MNKPGDSGRPDENFKKIDLVLLQMVKGAPHFHSHLAHVRNFLQLLSGVTQVQAELDRTCTRCVLKVSRDAQTVIDVDQPAPNAVRSKVSALRLAKNLRLIFTVEEDRLRLMNIEGMQVVLSSQSGNETYILREAILDSHESGALSITSAVSGDSRVGARANQYYSGKITIVLATEQNYGAPSLDAKRQGIDGLRKKLTVPDTDRQANGAKEPGGKFNWNPFKSRRPAEAVQPARQQDQVAGSGRAVQCDEDDWWPVLQSR